MLIPKKIDKKRLIIYFVVIGTMIGATAFLLLNNLKLSNQDDYDIGLDMMLDADMQADPVAELVVPKAKSDSIIKILDDPRFQVLEESGFSESEIKQENIGKKNPFEPTKPVKPDESVDEQDEQYE